LPSANMSADNKLYQDYSLQM